MVMKKIFLILLLPLFYTLSCSTNHSELVGKWKGHRVNYFNANELIWEFDDSNYMFDNGADGVIDLKGTWTTSTDTLFLTDIEGEAACPHTQKGIYIYKVSNDTLRLTLLEDDCEERTTVISKLFWVKQ